MDNDHKILKINWFKIQGDLAFVILVSVPILLLAVFIFYLRWNVS
jgi:hypothetical protein